MNTPTTLQIVDLKYIDAPSKSLSRGPPGTMPVIFSVLSSTIPTVLFCLLGANEGSYFSFRILSTMRMSSADAKAGCSSSNLSDEGLDIIASGPLAVSAAGCDMARAKTGRCWVSDDGLNIYTQGIAHCLNSRTNVRKSFLKGRS